MPGIIIELAAGGSRKGVRVTLPGSRRTLVVDFVPQARYCGHSAREISDLSAAGKLLRSGGVYRQYKDLVLEHIPEDGNKHVDWANVIKEVFAKAPGEFFNSMKAEAAKAKRNPDSKGSKPEEVVVAIEESEAGDDEVDGEEGTEEEVQEEVTTPKTTPKRGRPRKA